MTGLIARQASLFDADDEFVGPRPLALVRTELSGGAWIDVMPGWLAGAEFLFEHLFSAVPWQAERRPMYDRVVDVPRLLCFYGESDRLPHCSLTEAKSALDNHYAAELGEPFSTAGMCLYRNGDDSVAWHGDRIGRSRTEDTMVAILSLGAPRALMLRPCATGEHRSDEGADLPVSGARRPPADEHRSDEGARSGARRQPAGEYRSDEGTDLPVSGTPRPPAGASTLRFELGHGDLIVMGGSCQRTWEHAIPKTSKAVGPRISVQFRPRGVR